MLYRLIFLWFLLPLSSGIEGVMLNRLASVILLFGETNITHSLSAFAWIVIGVATIYAFSNHRKVLYIST